MLFMHLARQIWVDPKTPHTAHMHRQLRRRLPSQVSGSLPDPSRWMKRGLFMLFMLFRICTAVPRANTAPPVSARPRQARGFPRVRRPHGQARDVSLRRCGTAGPAGRPASRSRGRRGREQPLPIEWLHGAHRCLEKGPLRSGRAPRGAQCGSQPGQRPRQHGIRRRHRGRPSQPGAPASGAGREAQPGETRALDAAADRRVGRHVGAPRRLLLRPRRLLRPHLRQAGRVRLSLLHARCAHP